MPFPVCMFFIVTMSMWLLKTNTSQCADKWYFLFKVLMSDLLNFSEEVFNCQRKLFAHELDELVNCEPKANTSMTT